MPANSPAVVRILPDNTVVSIPLSSIKRGGSGPDRSGAYINGIKVTVIHSPTDHGEGWSDSTKRDAFLDYYNASNASYAEAGRYGSPDIYGHEFVRNLSDSDSSVYTNKLGQYIIAYRGSRFDRHASDYAADASLVFGLEGWNPRFVHALTKYRKVKVLAGDNAVHLTGHSLGGAEAAYVARQTGAKATIYNPGIGIDAILRTATGARHPNIEIARVPIDPLSVGAEFPSEGKETWYRPRGLNPHSMGNFKPKNTK